jgi:hypothetical protein
MTIMASAHKTVPLCANLPAATAALARKPARGPQLKPSPSINKAALDCIYLLNRRPGIEQAISSIRRHTDRAPPKSKSP